MKCRITEGISPVITLEIDDEVMPSCSKVAGDEKPLFPIGIGGGVMTICILFLLLTVVYIVCFCVTDVNALKIDLGAPLSVEVDHSNPDLLYLVVTCCVAVLSLVFCTLLCHVRVKMVQERRRALKDRYDFVSQLFNTVKDMRPFLPWTAGNGLGGKVYFGPMPDKTKTVYETKDTGKKTTEEAAEAKDTESGKKEGEERGAEGESKKGTSSGSEAGDSQPDVPPFPVLNGGGGMPPWGNGAYPDTEALSSVGSMQPQYINPDVTSITIIPHSPFGVSYGPGVPWFYYGYPNQKGR